MQRIVLMLTSLLAIFCLLPMQGSCNLTTNHPDLIGDIFAPVLRFRGGISGFNPITARVVLENDTTATQLDVSKRPVYEGAIVLARGYPWRTFFPWMENVGVPGGARAVLLREAKIDEATGWAEFITAPYETAFPIPVLAVSEVTFARIERIFLNLSASQQDSFRITVNDGGGLTPWRQVITHPVWWVVSIFTAAFSCAMAVFALIRFYDYYRASDGKWGVPQTVLLFQFIPAVMRFVYWSVDPINQRAVLPQVLHTPWRLWPLPFAISSVLVLVFYWFESVSQTSLRFSWNVEHYKWPCYILIALTFLICLGNSIIYWSSNDALVTWLLDYLEPGYYLLLTLALASFFLITSIRILHEMYKMEQRTSSGSYNPDSLESGQKKPSKRVSSRIRSTASKLIAVGITFVIIVCMGFYTLTPGFTNVVPNYFAYTWASVHIMLSVNAFCVMLVLVPPRRKPATSRQGTSSLSQSATSDSGLKT